jgi:hypothetical protein
MANSSELHYLHYTRNRIADKRIRWAQQTVCIWNKRVHTEFDPDDLEARYYFWPNAGKRMILKWIIMKCNMTGWAPFIRGKDTKPWPTPINTSVNFRVPFIRCANLWRMASSIRCFKNCSENSALLFNFFNLVPLTNSRIIYIVGVRSF